jgi:hypothetical protein
LLSTALISVIVRVLAEISTALISVTVRVLAEISTALISVTVRVLAEISLISIKFANKLFPYTLSHFELLERVITQCI